MDSKRKIAAGVAGLAMLAGAGGVYAATNDGDKERDAFADDVAKRLDVSREKLDSAVEGAFKDRLDAAVKNGKLTEKQADEILKKMKEHGGVPFGPGFGPHGPGFGPGGPGGPHKLHFRGHGPGGPLIAGIDTAAKYLGVSRDELRKQLSSGKSLADVAKAQDKSTSGLKQAMRETLESKLAKAVEDEDLTGKQRDEILARFDEHIDDIIAGKRPQKPEFGKRFHPTAKPARRPRFHRRSPRRRRPPPPRRDLRPNARRFGCPRRGSQRCADGCHSPRGDGYADGSHIHST